MAARKIGLELWLGSVILLWTLYPLLFTRTRGVVVLVSVTGLLAVLGWLTGYQPLMIWSGGLGLCNLTLALVLVRQPPNLWTGLSAGLVLLAMIDSNHRMAYLRRGWIAPGVIPAMLGAFVRLSGLTLATSIVLGLLVAFPAAGPGSFLGTGAFTIIGAGVFVTFLTLYLGYTNR
jgi:hypothetical protein